MNKDILVNKKYLANKILTELRYNKRYMYNWVKWFGNTDKDSLKIREYLEEEIENVNYEIKDSRFDVENCFIDAVPLFKKISRSEEELNNKDDENLCEREKNVISFAAENKINGAIEYNYFLLSDLKIMILGAIWVEVIGRELDNGQLSNDVYANRVSENTSSIFKPYFEAYSDFRDASFKEVKTLIENNKTGILVQTDLSKCFYSINIEILKGEITSFLEGSRVGEDVMRLNDYVFSVLEKYNDLQTIKEYIAKTSSQENHEVLPIGFFPSNVLINIYLKELDKEIKSRHNPIQYGRYVDDISFVIVKEINTAHVEDPVEAIVGEGQILGGAVHQGQLRPLGPAGRTAFEHAQGNVHARQRDGLQIHPGGHVGQVGAGADGHIEHGAARRPGQLAHQLPAHLGNGVAVLEAAQPLLGEIVAQRHPVIHLHVLSVIALEIGRVLIDINALLPPQAGPVNVRPPFLQPISHRFSL